MGTSKATVGIVGAEDAEKVEERDFTKEQTTNQVKAMEEDFLQGLVDAAGYGEEEQKKIEIVRPVPGTDEKRVYFSFTIRPLSEAEYNKCKKKHTKYVRNRAIGLKMPEDTDNVKYRAQIIYSATIPGDRKKLWDNKEAWEALRSKGLQILNGLDVIEYTLKAGEKDAVIDQIDKLSGYADDVEEVANN